MVSPYVNHCPLAYKIAKASQLEQAYPDQSKNYTDQQSLDNFKTNNNTTTQSLDQTPLVPFFPRISRKKVAKFDREQSKEVSPPKQSFLESL